MLEINETVQEKQEEKKGFLAISHLNIKTAIEQLSKKEAFLYFVLVYEIQKIFKNSFQERSYYSKRKEELRKKLEEVSRKKIGIKTFSNFLKKLEDNNLIKIRKFKDSKTKSFSYSINIISNLVINSKKQSFLKLDLKELNLLFQFLKEGEFLTYVVMNSLLNKEQKQSKKISFADVQRRFKNFSLSSNTFKKYTSNLFKMKIILKSESYTYSGFTYRLTDKKDWKLTRKQKFVGIERVCCKNLSELRAQEQKFVGIENKEKRYRKKEVLKSKTSTSVLVDQNDSRLDIKKTKRIKILDKLDQRQRENSSNENKLTRLEIANETKKILESIRHAPIKIRQKKELEKMKRRSFSLSIETEKDKEKILNNLTQKKTKKIDNQKKWISSDQQKKKIFKKFEEYQKFSCLNYRIKKSQYPELLEKLIKFTQKFGGIGGVTVLNPLLYLTYENEKNGECLFHVTKNWREYCKYNQKSEFSIKTRSIKWKMK